MVLLSKFFLFRSPAPAIGMNGLESWAPSGINIWIMSFSLHGNFFKSLQINAIYLQIILCSCSIVVALLGGFYLESPHACSMSTYPTVERCYIIERCALHSFLFPKSLAPLSKTKINCCVSFLTSLTPYLCLILHSCRDWL